MSVEMRNEAKAILDSDVFKKLGYRPLVAGLQHGLQMVHTPYKLCHEIISKLAESIDLKKQENIAVLFNLEFAIVLIEDFGVKPTQITFMSDSDTEAAIARHWFNIKKVPRITYDGSKKNAGERIEIMPKIKKQFDCVIMNPPYLSGLHLQFLELGMKLVPDGGTVLCVHPATWIMCKKPNPYYQEMRDLVRQSVVDLTVFNPNQVFAGTEMGCPCVITHLCKNSGKSQVALKDETRDKSWTYKNIDDINIFGNYPEYFSLAKKIFAHIATNGSVDDHIGSKGVFYVNLPKITGHLDTSKNPKSLYRDDFFTLCNGKTSVSQSPDQQPFGFKTKSEAANFLSFAQSKIARFCVSFFKFNKNNHRGELKAVPWLDFTKQWNLPDVIKTLGITKKELAFIDQMIPNWYGDETYARNQRTT